MTFKKKEKKLQTIPQSSTQAQFMILNSQWNGIMELE